MEIFGGKFYAYYVVENSGKSEEKGKGRGEKVKIKSSSKIVDVGYQIPGRI